VLSLPLACYCRLSHPPHCSSVTTWFKALGCKVAPLSPGDQKKKNLSDADSDKKFAQLKVPVVFPTLKNKPTGRR